MMDAMNPCRRRHVASAILVVAGMLCVVATDTPSIAHGAPAASVVAASSVRSVAAPAAARDAVAALTVREIGYNATHAFVFAAITQEFCTSGSAPTIRRVDLVSGQAEVLISHCDLATDEIVATDRLIYYTNDLTDEILEEDTDPLHPAHDPRRVVVAKGHNLMHSKGLAVDPGYLYWGDDYGLQRVELASRTVTILAPDAWTNDLAVDATHVYWIEGGPGHGAVKRVPKGRVREPEPGIPDIGGGVETLVSEGLDYPTKIALDDSHVYWTEGTGVVRRVAKSGDPTITDFGTRSATLEATYLAVSSTHVFWTVHIGGGETGRLLRASKAAPAEVTELEIGLYGLNQIALTTDRVYYADFSGIYRIALDAGATEPNNISIEKVEVTQGIQNLANEVRVVAHKPTFVRVYPRVSKADVHGVTGQLRGFRGGSELPGSPLHPLTPKVDVYKWGWSRNELSNSFNYLLPMSWLEGAIELTAEVNLIGAGAEPEAGRADNVAQHTVTFTDVSAPCIKVMPIRTHVWDSFDSDSGTHEGTYYSRTNPDFDEIIDRFESLMPIPNASIWEGYELGEFEFEWALDAHRFGAYELPADEDWIMLNLMRHHGLEIIQNNSACKLDNGIGAQFHMMGTIHPRTDGIVTPAGETTEEYHGLGNYGLNTSWVTMFNDHDKAAKPFGEPAGGSLMAHEIGHNYVISEGKVAGTSPWYHVPCDASSDLNFNYPYRGDMNPDGTFRYNHIGPLGRDSHWGFDLLTRSTIAPNEASDFMSYCRPQWVSDYRWNLAIGAFSDHPSFQLADLSARQPNIQGVSTVSQSQEALTVLGVFTPTTGSASLTYLYRLPTGVFPVPPGQGLVADGVEGEQQQVTTSLQLVSASGTVLASQPVELMAAGNQSARELFAASMPYHPDTTVIQLVRGDRVIASRPVSPSAPTVRVTTPNGGENVSDRLVVSWTAADADPTSPTDPLRYIVEYSPDRGSTWLPIADEQIKTTLTITKTQGIPGSVGQSLVRVIASDGVNTAIDASDRPFTLQRHAPTVSISSPEEGEILPSGTSVILMGRADDTEDLTVDEDRMAWTVDGQPAGTGRAAASAVLTAGEHKAVLRATDSDGLSTSAEVSFIIGDPECTNGRLLDIVFVVDTSNRMMSNELPKACEFIAAAGAALRERGFDVQLQSYGVTATGTCLHKTVRMAVPGSIVNHPSDWGQAVVDLAGGHAWRAEARRIIVPISDAGPEDGSPVQDPGADRSVIQAAITVATGAGAVVMPLIIEPMTTATTLLSVLARDLASDTGGTVLRLDDGAVSLSVAVASDPLTQPCSAGLYLSPATTVLHVGHESVVEVRAQGMRGLYGMQIELAFGREVAEVVDSDPASPGVQIEAGELLAPQPQVLRNSASNTRGTIEFSASLQGNKPGVEGDGVVARIHLRGKAAGTTPLAFTRAILSDPKSNPLNVTRRDGLLVVRVANPGDLPFTVQGKVALERRSKQAGAKVCDGANCATTGADGRFTLAGVKLNDTVIVTHPSYLQSERKLAAPPDTVGGTVTLPDVILLGGDVDQNRQVYAADAVEIGKSWNAGTGQARYLPKLDVTDDGGINLLDMVAVQFNFAQKAPGPWARASSVDIASTAPRMTRPSSQSSPDRSPAAGSPLSRAAEWVRRLHILAAEPMLRLDPAEAKGTRSTPVRVDLRVDNVSKLFAFNVKLRFDPTMLRVHDANPNQDGVQMLVGEFLDVENLIIVHNKADNVTGEAQLVVTETNPATGRDGSGILGTILFDGLRGGRSEVTFIESELFDDGFPGAANIQAQATGGAVVMDDSFTILAPYVVRGWPQP